MVAGFPGTSYPTAQAELIAVFVPLVGTVVSILLKWKVAFSCNERSGEIQRGTLLPVEVSVCWF